MNGFNFEKNLTHQSQAVESTVAVFENLQAHSVAEIDKNYVNPVYNKIEKIGNIFTNQIIPFGQYSHNINKQQQENNIKESPKSQSNIIDIMMETGTGKTYTYTKTIFELNKFYGIFKFIVVVPTLSIKAGTVDFLKSDSSREHFKEQYGKTLHLHIVESQKNNKSKKSFLPPAVSSFVNAGKFDKTNIQILIINSGMINSETMQKSFDKSIFDKYSVPFDAVAATKPFMIIDEPHKFAQSNKTWENVLKMKPQFILRYGATFPDKEIKQKNILTNKIEKAYVKDYHNLIYTLSAVDSFNNNLVKGVIGHITEFEAGKNVIVKFTNSNGKEASFELTENNNKKTVKISQKESLSTIHSEMTDLIIEKLNKNTIVLSNGLEMKIGEKINPYSYAETLQETMIQKAIKNHFEIEKELLSKSVRIKPLTLFFIDNIDEYRNKEGYIRKTVETHIKAEVENLLKKLEPNSDYYYNYLQKTLSHISLTHAGYFSKDNSEKDEAIEKEINEILHDKQAILDLDNPRRFIFSKWTLREGWDNPNVFQICKLRSSGSEISKLQEVGRGLRLPVNEYGNRVKDEQFYLNYFVDFTESDFVDKLVNEINEKSGAISIEKIPEKLSDEMLKQIMNKYNFNDENALLQKLIVEEKVIDFSRKFLDGGFDYIKQNFHLIFDGVNSNKIRKVTNERKQITVRTEKYQELKALWEKINEKVILEYKFNNEEQFTKLFAKFLKTPNILKVEGINEITKTLKIEDGKASAKESESIYNEEKSNVKTMKYSDFLKSIAKNLNINLKTVHQSIINSEIEINNYLNQTTLRIIKENFNYYLMTNAITNFGIEYKKVSNKIHPTKLTDENGDVYNEISASDVGTLFSDGNVADNYFFEELYYDSELEKTNIETKIEEVIIFTKIPKNSIKIPVAGGKSYSPDFAYVLKFKDGEQKLHFIVETKDANSEDGLRNEEKFKIKHAEKFFADSIKIQFKTQFSGTKITTLINEISQPQQQAL